MKKASWAQSSRCCLFAWLLFIAGFSAQAASLNEWTFEADANGMPLSAAINSGTASPKAQFAAGFQSSVFTTNRTLVCIGKDAGTGGAWTNGAILNAALTATTSGVYYLRYDVAYDFSSTNNDSGNVLGVYFAGESGDEATGLVLGYDAGNLQSTIPTNQVLTAVTGVLGFSGKLTAIAEVNLNTNPAVLKVWYGLNGSTPTNYSSVAATTNISLTAISSLQFHATGDFRLDGSSDGAAVDNIRMADSWADITAPIPDFSTGPAVEIVSITVTNPAGTAGSDIGDTNTVNVVLRNLSAPSSNVIASVSAATHSEYFTITSSNTPGVLTYPQYATNTFSLIVNTNALNGTYTFNVNVTGSGGVNTNTTFNLTVGSLISYMSNSITVVSTNGILPGQYEPGEVIDITVSSINNGALDVSNVVNSLSADPAYFSISNLTSSAYASMPVGASSSSVYRVAISPSATNGDYSFSVTNRAGSKVWTDYFPLNVFSQAIPSLSTNALTFQVSQGNILQKQVVVSNAGNASLNFSITNNAAWSSVLSVNTSTTTSTQLSGGTAIPLVGPSPAQASYAGESDTISIGFAFPFYGTTYSNLYVDSNGAILLSNSNIVNNTAWADGTTGDLPRGSRPLIAPFRNKQLVIPDESPIRYVRRSNPSSLVLIYNGATLNVAPTSGTNLQFQTELFADGRIKFSYYNINGSFLDEVAVGLQGSASSYTNFNFIPASGTAVLAAPEENRWVTCSPINGTVPPLSSTNIMFTADATSQTAGAANAFTSTFNWSSGGSDDVAVSASVVAAAPLLVTPANVLFYGNAGDIASTTMVLSNAGNAALNFTITDTNSTAAAYQGTVSVSTNWTDISSPGTPLVMLDPHENPYITATNEGFSALQPIGFEFPFYGGVYTQFSAGVNGGISLGSTNRISAGNNFGTSREDIPQRFIAPYWGNLFLDSNASIRFRSTTNELVVTWQNMEQQGVVPGSDLTFQAVLYASGRIEFRYQQINGFSWQFTKWGIRSGSSKTASGLLVLPGDGTVTTNEYGYLQTSVVNAIANRAVSITSSNYPVITYTPLEGNIPAGGASTVTLRGNASGMTPGSPFNSITNTANLNIAYEAGANTVVAMFVVTNSVENAMMSPLASPLDEDGDGMTYDEELITGTDPFSAGSVFAVSTANGRVLSWPSAAGRTYTILYTLDLMESFQPLEGAIGLTTNTFTDTLHTAVPVIYYKVTID